MCAFDVTFCGILTSGWYLNFDRNWLDSLAADQTGTRAGAFGGAGALREEYSMGYLISQLWLCLLLAFLLGAFLTWLLWVRPWQKRFDEADQAWNARHQKLKGDYRALEISARETAAELESKSHAASKLEVELSDSKKSLHSAEATFATLSGEHEALKASSAEQDQNIDRLQAEIVSQATDLDIERSNVKSLEDKRNALQAEIDELRATISGLEKDASALQSDIGKLRGAEQQLNEVVTALRKDIAAAGDESENQLQLIASLKDEQIAHERQLADVERSVSSLSAEKQSLFGELETDRSELERLRRALAEAEQELSTLRIRLQERDQAVTEAEAGRSSLAEEHSQFEQTLAELRLQLQQMETEQTAIAQARDAAQSDLGSTKSTLRQSESAVQDLEAKLARCEAAQTKLRQQLAKATEKPKMASYGLKAPMGRADDLKRIKGIGPKLEGILHGLGIFHFRQIAKFTKADVEWVSQHLAEFKGRIERDDWLRQATSLHRADYNEAP